MLNSSKYKKFITDKEREKIDNGKVRLKYRTPDEK
jgi:hypothetical protein